jgi:colicin import membrane protein
MAAPRTRTPRARKPAAETQAEFEKIAQEAEQEKLQSDSKTEELRQIAEVEVRQAVGSVSVESVVGKVGSLGIEISKALSDIAAQLVSTTNLLASLRDAAALETREIERLHKIDVAQTTIDQLLEQYARQKTALEQEMEQTRAAWAAEQQNREKEQKEFDEYVKRTRTREKEEYEYNKLLVRKKEEDEYKEAQRLQERKNREKQEALEKSWALREAALRESEQELAALQVASAEFPAKLKAEVDKAVAETLKAQEAKHRQELAILEKGFEAEKRVAELKIASLEETVAKLDAQMASLSTRLDEAKQQVQDIAIKAIEGASGARALAHVNQIAMEQAKTRSGPQG